jgi:hypothetical protein
MGASPRPCARRGHHERWEAGTVLGRARQTKQPERGRGWSARRIVPAKVGNRAPRAPREGRHRRASRCCGGSYGSDSGLTNHIHATPEHGTAGLSRGQGQHREAPHGVSPVWFATGVSWWRPRHRRRSWRTSGSVGRAPGNRCLYPEGDGLQPTLRFSFQPRLMPSVRLHSSTVSELSFV